MQSIGRETVKENYISVCNLNVTFEYTEFSDCPRPVFDPESHGGLETKIFLLQAPKCGM